MSETQGKRNGEVRGGEKRGKQRRKETNRQGEGKRYTGERWRETHGEVGEEGERSWEGEGGQDRTEGRKGKE